MKEKDWVRGMPRPGTPGLREALQWAGHWPGLEHSLAGGGGGGVGEVCPPLATWLVRALSSYPFLLSKQKRT